MAKKMAQFVASGEDDPQVFDPPKFDPSYMKEGINKVAPKDGSKVHYGKDGLCGVCLNLEGRRLLQGVMDNWPKRGKGKKHANLVKFFSFRPLIWSVDRFKPFRSLEVVSDDRSSNYRRVNFPPSPIHSVVE
jgi:hypothetical protein